MEAWKQFEIEAVNYLNNKYSNNKVNFIHNGGSDSTISDIQVLYNNKIRFLIEAKMPKAQSGQFVLIPNSDKRIFEFSPKNKSQENELTDIIISYMNTDFNTFNNAGTSGKNLNIDNSIFAKWIVSYYKSKDVNYIISKFKNSFVILPIHKFDEYFNINAKYRIKKSGSSPVGKTRAPKIIKILERNFWFIDSHIDDKKLFINSSTELDKHKFVFENNDFMFSKKGNNLYEVRKLSNTYNMNVIFSIELLKNQNTDDLNAFENSLK